MYKLALLASLLVPDAILMEQGMICDQIEEVVDAITLIEKHESPMKVSGCGMLSKPVVMKVVSLGTYDTAKGSYHLVRYEFNGQVQFGIFSVTKIGLGA